MIIWWKNLPATWIRWFLQKGLGATPGEDDVSRLARSLTKKFARFLAPKMVVALEPQIKAGVEKYLAELNTMQKTALSAIPAKAEIQQQNGMARVTLTEPNSGQTFQFQMAKPPEGNKWRIVEINYQDLRTIIEKKFIELNSLVSPLLKDSYQTLSLIIYIM